MMQYRVGTRVRSESTYSHSQQGDDNDPETPLSSSDEEEDFQRSLDDDWEQSSVGSGLTAQLEPRRPFEYFRPKVEVLVRSLQDQGFLPPAQLVQVTGRPGNEEYRLFHIVLDRDIRVLRVARRSTQDIRHTTRMLSWLHRYTSLPVPMLLHRDRYAGNPLGRPYIITTYLCGVPLAEVYHSATIGQRMSIAAQVAKLIHDISSVPVPDEEGLAVIDDYNQLVVAPFTSADTQQHTTSSSLPLQTSGPRAGSLPRLRAHTFFANILKEPKPEDRKPPSKSVRSSSTSAANVTEPRPHGPLFAPLTRMMQRLTAREASSSAPVLSHHGLDPSNIIVQYSSERSPGGSSSSFEWKISGVTFWDDCRVVPVVEAFAMPSYLSETPCSRTRRCKNGCRCVGNDDYAPSVVQHIREHFIETVERFRSPAVSTASEEVSLSARIKSSLLSPPLRLLASGRGRKP